jgi:L-threonylcarbamoyladenylate synthase
VRTVPFEQPGDYADAAPAVAEHLLAGGLIAYPTETVYGFGCALHQEPLIALARLKQREAGKPFLLLVLDAEQGKGLIWMREAVHLAAAFWPGPLTLVLRTEPDAYPQAVVSEAAVAIRATPHPGVRTILRALDAPLTSTSVNQPGQPPATNVQEVTSVVGALGAPENLWVLDGGQLPPSAPSTIVDCAGDRPRLRRPGAIPLARLRAVVKEIDA